MLIQGADHHGSGFMTSLTFLVDALSASAAAQKIAIECLAKNNVIRCSGDIERSAIDEYLGEDNAQLLDACRDLSETVEVIRNYSHSLQVALHSLHGLSPPTTAALARASHVLGSSDQLTMETNMKRGGGGGGGGLLSRRLSQLNNNNKKSSSAADHELSEILGGSCSIASTACQILGVALSFKSKGGFPTVQSRPTSSWSCSLHELHKGLEEEMKKTRKSGGGLVMLTELRETIMAAQQLRIQIKNHNKHNELGVIVEELKRKCEALEEIISPLDEKVDDLYRNLISLRMALLGILSQA